MPKAKTKVNIGQKFCFELELVITALQEKILLKPCFIRKLLWNVKAAVLILDEFKK